MWVTLSSTPTVSGIREWFRWYKTPDGKPVNGFGHDERALNAAETKEIIAETNASTRSCFWRDGGRQALGAQGGADESAARRAADDALAFRAAATAPSSLGQTQMVADLADHAEEPQ